LSRPLPGEDLRDGIWKLAFSAYLFAGYFAGGIVPKSKERYVGAVSIALLAVMVVLIARD